MGPQNYTLSNAIDPGQSFLQGLQSGEQQMLMRQQQAMQLQQQQQALQAQQRREQALLAVIQRPTEQNYAALIGADPKQHEAYQKLWTSLDAKRKQSTVSDLLQWTAAIDSGRHDVAVAAMRSRADMMDRDAGGASPEGQALRAQADAVQADPQLVARTYFEPMLQAEPTAKDAIVNLRAMREERRTAAKAPAELRTAEAGATKAEADAATAQVTAEFARPKSAAELQQAAAQLGLTTAQTTQAIVTTKKLNAEIQQAALTAATGDPAKRFEFEKKLRDEFTTQAKEAILTQDAYKRMTASRKDAVGDIALIFGYMKMLDPTSVVREGEFATAQSAAGVPERILNLYNKAVEGKTALPEGQRQKILAQARELALKADEKVANVRSGLMPAVSAYKLDQNNIFSVGASVPADQPKPQPAPPGEQTAINPQTGERLVLRGGKWVPFK
jgi:hypothetical protein